MIENKINKHQKKRAINKDHPFKALAATRIIHVLVQSWRQPLLQSLRYWRL